MTPASSFTPSSGTPLVVPALEPINDESVEGARIAPRPPVRARVTSRKPLAATVNYEGPLTTPVPSLTHGSTESHWPSRHPPDRYSLTLPATTPVTSKGASNEFNFRGHVALGVGLVCLALVAIMWATGGGLWWAYVGCAGFAIWSGVRGHSAANRGLATNARQARVGIVAGALAIVGAIAFFVSVMVSVSSV